MSHSDEAYLALVVKPIQVCATYKPKFGQGAKGGGLSLEQFQSLYQNDPFYNWFGLDNPLMYAAHKAAGGMTSVYRQIGIGCETLFRIVLRDSFGLQDADVIWSYELPAAGGKTRTLYLDARIPLEKINDAAKRERLHEWMRHCAQVVGVKPKVFDSLTGTVFEVRQGYKSKDSKRQNADIANAATAYINGYLPCATILSNQIDGDVLTRYRAAKWTVLTGTLGANSPETSTYDFMKDVVGYDFSAFFQRNREVLREEIDKVLAALLAPETVESESVP